MYRIEFLPIAKEDIDYIITYGRLRPQPNQLKQQKKQTPLEIVCQNSIILLRALTHT